MSSVPPDWSAAPPPPPPPTLPPGGPLAPLPWERWREIGFMEALVSTVKLLITNPTEAWARTPAKGNLLDPLLFSIMISWVGAAIFAFYGLFFAAPWLRFMPPQYRERFGSVAAGHAVGFIAQIILAPVFITIFLFIMTAIIHLCLMLVGGLTHSP